jgi:hypothetical protein
MTDTVDKTKEGWGGCRGGGGGGGGSGGSGGGGGWRRCGGLAVVVGGTQNSPNEHSFRSHTRSTHTTSSTMQGRVGRTGRGFLEDVQQAATLGQTSKPSSVPVDAQKQTIERLVRKRDRMRIELGERGCERRGN